MSLRKKKSDRGSAFISREYKTFCKHRNIEIEYSSPRLYNGTGAVERSIWTLTKLNIANLEDRIGLTESLHRALRVMRFTIHTGLKMSTFQFQYGEKPRNKLANIVNDKKNSLFGWTTMKVSVPPKKIPIFLARNEKGEMTDRTIMARRKIRCCTSHKSPKRRPVKPVSGKFSHPYTFFDKRIQKKSDEGKYEEKPNIRSVLPM